MMTAMCDEILRKRHSDSHLSIFIVNWFEQNSTTGNRQDAISWSRKGKRFKVRPDREIWETKSFTVDTVTSSLSSSLRPPRRRIKLQRQARIHKEVGQPLSHGTSFLTLCLAREI